MAPKHLAFMMAINLIWGFALIAAKVALEHFPPFLFTALRFGLILLVLFPFLKIHRERMSEVLIIALCAGPLGFGLFFLGVAAADVSVVAIAGQLGVPITALMGVAFLGEKVAWRRWLGIAMSFGGVMYISFDPAVFQYVGGLIFIVLSAFVGSIGTIFQRRIRGVGVFELQAWIAAVAFPLMAIASLGFEQDHIAFIATAGWEAWGGIVYVAMASSLIGHAGMYYLLQRYEVTTMAPLTLLAPLSTIFFGVTLLGDEFTERMAIGGAIALIGVLIVSIRQKKIVNVGP